MSQCESHPSPLWLGLCLFWVAQRLSLKAFTQRSRVERAGRTPGFQSLSTWRITSQSDQVLSAIYQDLIKSGAVWTKRFTIAKIRESEKGENDTLWEYILLAILIIFSDKIIDCKKIQPIDLTAYLEYFKEFSYLITRNLERCFNE